MARLSSSLYIRRSIGPIIDPYGAPLVMVVIFELKLFIEAECFGSTKYDSNIYLVFLLFHNNICYQQYQGSFEDQQKYLKQNYFHQGHFSFN